MHNDFVTDLGLTCKSWYVVGVHSKSVKVSLLAMSWMVWLRVGHLVALVFGGGGLHNLSLTASAWSAVWNKAGQERDRFTYLRRQSNSGKKRKPSVNGLNKKRVGREKREWENFEPQGKRQNNKEKKLCEGKEWRRKKCRWDRRAFGNEWRGDFWAAARAQQTL